MRGLRQATYLFTQSPAGPRLPPATQLPATTAQVLSTTIGSAETISASMLWTQQTVVHKSQNLAQDIKKELVSKVNNGPFVVTFDESLNKLSQGVANRSKMSFRMSYERF